MTTSNLPGHLYDEIFSPFSLYIWRDNAEVMGRMGTEVRRYSLLAWIFYAFGVFCCYQTYRGM